MRRQETDRSRIAIIDDEPDFRAIVRGWLSPRYDTMSFANAEELLDSDPDSLAPDLVVTDVRMPGLSGFRVCEILRAHPRLSDVPVLILTGVGSDEGFLQGVEAGAAAYLTKPVERTRLLGKVAELLDARLQRL
jgi:CheY-like chemotaxis protein